MMTDEQRKKNVALSLRYIAERPPEWAVSACAIAEVLDDNYPLWQDTSSLFIMLADLIDPLDKGDN